MDALDRRILKALQRDSGQSISEVAGEINLSPSAAHRRIKLLEDAGIITGYAARLDRVALGLRMELFVTVSLNSQANEALEAFERAVMLVPEIVTCNLLAGRADYLLRVVVADMEDFERLHRNRLARLPGVATMTTSFSLRNVKSFQGYPL